MRLLTKGRFYFFSVLLFCALSSRAQDFHLSQYDAAPMYLNPALTGLVDGPYRIYGNYRSQWGSIIPKAFTTAAVAGDMSIKRYGAGVQIMNNRAGSGGYNVFNFLLSGSYDLPLDGKGNHIRGGIQLGFIQKSLNMSKLIFNNQYVNSGDGSFNTTLPNGENFGDQSVFLPAVNMGYNYYYGNISSKLNPFLGLAIYNIVKPKESLLNAGVRLPMRFVVHGGTKINFTEQIQAAPRFLFMQQQNVREISAGVLLHYYFKEASTFFLIGSDYRLKDAVVIHLGMKKESFLYRISYDVNTSALNAFSRGRGAMEFSVTYVPEKKKEKRIRSCNRI